MPLFVLIELLHIVNQGRSPEDAEKLVDEDIENGTTGEPQRQTNR